MKNSHLTASIFSLFLLSSCVGVLSATPSTTIGDGVIRLELVPPTNEFHSFDDINFQIILTNQGDESILVHSRLHYISMNVPASISEMLILIFDSNGNQIVRQCDPNYAGPRVDTLDELQPGKQITKTFYLRASCFFDDSLFTPGEKYDVVAIYQNNIDTVKTINGIGLTQKTFEWLAT